jgi:hypothetical protein
MKMKKKMPRAFNRKLKKEYRKGYAQRSLEVRNLLFDYISTMLTQQGIDYVNAGVDVTISVPAKELIDLLNMKEKKKND